MGKAFLITHPETALDKDGRIHGRLDPPLSDSGKLKARQIARQFARKNVSKIHSSPRNRALQTAEALRKTTGAAVEVHDELIPWDLGTLSGAKVSSIRPLLDFFSSRPDQKIPSGEAKNDVLKRYARFMKTVKPGEVIVGHSQHSLAHDFVKKGGNAAKVPMFGGRAAEIREIEV